MEGETSTGVRIQRESIEGDPFFSVSSNGAEEIREYVKEFQAYHEKHKEKKERLSLLNRDGTLKELSKEETRLIGIERQWILLSQWLSATHGLDDLLWKGWKIYPENIDRLERSHFKLIEDHPASKDGHFMFELSA